MQRSYELEWIKIYWIKKKSETSFTFLLLFSKSRKILGGHTQVRGNGKLWYTL